MEQLEKGISKKLAWPRVPYYYNAYGLEHLAKDCSQKPNNGINGKISLNLVDMITNDLS